MGVVLGERRSGILGRRVCPKEGTRVRVLGVYHDTAFFSVLLPCGLLINIYIITRSLYDA